MHVEKSDKGLRIGLVCEGDASRSETAFSGTAKRMYQSLVMKGHDVIPVNASLTGIRRGVVAAISISRDRQAWRSKFRYGNDGAKYRTGAALASLGKKSVDIILQVGATYAPPKADSVPYAIYCDWNMALTLAEAKAGGGSSNGLSIAEIESIGREHARRYQNASAIFTISERLRLSFIELYGISPNKVYTAYAGPNFDMELIDHTLLRPKQSQTPSVLFIAKEFERKGGDLVAGAFASLEDRVPGVKLVFAGAASLPAAFRSLRNVESLGLLDKSNPQQLERLLSAYREADVLVLPSRRDPFPTVIREAMFFGLPCVASNIWAMPEMIDDGKTGYLVPPEDSAALLSRLTFLLEDAEMRTKMGKAARARAQEMFSWDSVGKVLSDGLEQCLSGQ